MKIEVNDRVAVYGFDRDYAEKVLKRKILRIGASGLLETDAGEFVHPKQCRRLKKKVRREFWIHEDDLPLIMVRAPYAAGCVRFIEALK